VDIEMLCQQALNILEEATSEEQEIRLSVEPDEVAFGFG